MVYESESFRLCHEVSAEGKREWERVLEAAADEILWAAEHPVRSRLKRLWAWVLEVLGLEL